MKFIQESKDAAIDLLVLDVDQKDPSLPLRCPPECFVDIDALQQAKRILAPNGIMGNVLCSFSILFRVYLPILLLNLFLAINLVCRDGKKRLDIISRVKSVFAYCYVMDCEIDINKILILSHIDIENRLMEEGKKLRSSLSAESSDTVAFLLSKLRLG